MYKYILFDFDGTVFDTVEGITKSVRYAINKRGMDAPLDSLRCFAGPPLVDMYMEHFGGTPEERLTVFDFRMVRSILAVLIGMGLAVSGAVFQTISKNELASPSLLGVNAGAALAVMLLIYGSSSATGLGIWQQPLAAVVGGALAAALVFFLSHRRGRMTSTYNLVLNGIAVTAGLHALQILLLVSLDPTRFQQVNTWLIGSIFGNSWTHVDILFFIVLAGLLFLLANHETLDLLALHEETALLGGILLVAADYTARIIIAPDEMLVGLVVSLIGAPYFLYILLRSKG